MKFIDFQYQHSKYIRKIINSIFDVCKKGDFILGESVDQLESLLPSFTGHKYCISCANGSDAIYLAIRALNIPPGSLICTTPFTFIATGDSILRAGCVPLFCDIEKDTFNIDPNAVCSAIKTFPETSAVLSVDIFGVPANYLRLKNICLKHNIPLIADCAQSFGSLFHGSMCGVLADISTTSFFPTKPLGCYGDGGAIFTDDPQIKLKLHSLRKHGNGIELGVNSRLDSIQAAILLVKLVSFYEELALRNELAKLYRSTLKDSVLTQKVPAASNSAWALFSIMIKNRDELFTLLKTDGVESKVYYSKPLHKMKLFKKYSCRDLRVTDYVSNHVLSLPFYPYMKTDDVIKVAYLVNKHAVPLT